MTSATFDEWWELYTLGVGPADAQLRALGEDERRLVRDRCAQLLGPGPIDVRSTAWAAKARA